MPVADLSASIPARFARAIAKSRLSQEQKIGVAVSGGGDSIALMHLAVRLCGPDRLRVLTVDHGLRPEAKDEIAQKGLRVVVTECSMLRKRAGKTCLTVREASTFRCKEVIMRLTA